MIKKYLILFVIILLAAFLRFYNLMWDQPYFFNPDERNMAHAITGLSFPQQMNPRFFAYGQFPLYLAYFSHLFVNLPYSIIHDPRSMIQSDPFPQAIFWLRFWSATSSVFTVLIVYLITQRLICLNSSSSNPKSEIRNPKQIQPFDSAQGKNSNDLKSKAFSIYHLPFAYLAALCAAFTPSLIQSAHFGTTESLLSFFFILSIYLSILYVSRKIQSRYFIPLVSVCLGLAFSTKVSAFIFLIVPFLAVILKYPLRKIGKTLLVLLLVLLSTSVVFFFTSPFNFIDFNGFKGSMDYESGVALGTMKVFYTIQFENTTPVLFHLQKVFPYAVGTPMFMLGTLGFLLMNINLIINTIKAQRSKLSSLGGKSQNQNLKLKTYVILISAFFIYFITNAFLYAKWTRFLGPMFPLFAIFAAYALSTIWNPVHPTNNKRIIGNWIIGLLVFISVVPGFSFFTIYTRPDSRVVSSKWIYQNIPADSYVLSETANVIDIPVNLPNNEQPPDFNSQVISFNFYELDQIPERFPELLDHLEKANYIFIPSRRIFTNHRRLPKTYPLINRYYDLLFSGRLGFEPVAEFTSFPSLLPSSFTYNISPKFPDEQAEETFTVFDHPVIRIYKKIVFFEKQAYQSMFGK